MFLAQDHTPVVDAHTLTSLLILSVRPDGHQQRTRTRWGDDGSVVRGENNKSGSESTHN
jgi:hypothetical protein